MHHVHKFRFNPASKFTFIYIYHFRVILEKVEEKLAQYHQDSNEHGFNQLMK